MASTLQWEAPDLANRMHRVVASLTMKILLDGSEALQTINFGFVVVVPEPG